MFKCVKWLGGATAVVAMVAGAMLLQTPRSAHADSPPNPPARFVGTVKVDGAAVPAGTTIEAKIGSASCGATTTFTVGSDARYTLDVPGLDPGATPNCGTDGATVSFWIGGKKAIETGSWRNYDLNTVNLTYVTPTPTPAASPAGTPGATQPAATPRPPATGAGLDGGAGNGALGFAAVAVALGVIAFGFGGVAAVRRSK